MTARRARANGEGSIYARKVKGQDAGYAAYVWVTRPNGTRSRKYVYGQTREETHEKWLRLHRQASEGPVASGVPTLGNYVSYCMEEIVTPNLAPLTAATYETFVRLYLVPGLGSKRLDRLQVRDVQAWINRLPRTCQCCAQGKDARRPEKHRRCCAATPRACCKDYPSSRTVKDIRGCLRSVLANAVREELVPRNVAALVKLPAIR